MRLDIPDDIPYQVPRCREVEPHAQPLDPGPVARRRVQLADRAAENRGPAVPPPRRDRSREPERPQLPRERNQTHDQDPHHRFPLDRRPARRDLPLQGIAIALREEERRALTDIGRFRVIATRDLAETVYSHRASRMERDLAFLKQHGLVETNAVNIRRDGRGGRVAQLEVVTLTKAGRDLVQRVGQFPDGQKLYAGLVKPREVEHDTQIYRAYTKEAERIERNSGSNLRVRLDFELKAQIQKAIYAARKADPGRDILEIKQQVAQQHELPYVNNSIQIPDARIEYDIDQGGRAGHSDIEVLTAAYHAGHLRGKAQSGFQMYASASDRATLTARVENEHHLLDDILEL